MYKKLKLYARCDEMKAELLWAGDTAKEPDSLPQPCRLPPPGDMLACDLRKLFDPAITDCISWRFPCIGGFWGDYPSPCHLR